MISQPEASQCALGSSIIKPSLILNYYQFSCAFAAAAAPADPAPALAPASAPAAAADPDPALAPVRAWGCRFLCGAL
eukprot:5949283-Karenia_brevis.AAC.1